MWLMEERSISYTKPVCNNSVFKELLRWSVGDRRPSTFDDVKYEVLFKYVGKKVHLIIFRLCAARIISYYKILGFGYRD